MRAFLRGLYRSDENFDAVIKIRGSKFSIYQKNLLHGPVPLTKTKVDIVFKTPT